MGCIASKELKLVSPWRFWRNQKFKMEARRLFKKSNLVRQRRNQKLHIEKLPEEILIKIFRHLPVVDAIRLGTVSKKWQERKNSCTLPVSFDDDVPIQKPWYYMFSQLGRSKMGCLYNSNLKLWRRYDFLSLPSRHFAGSVINNFYDYYCSFSSSNGLLCVREYVYPHNIYICNPIFLNRGRFLPEVPNTDPAVTYNATVGISVDLKSKIYKVFFISYSKEEETSPEFDVTINLYESNKNCWRKVYQAKKHTMDTDHQCVVCKDVLYEAVYLNIFGSRRPCHGVVSYELAEPTAKSCYTETRIKGPGDFKSANIMNLRDKLVLVGHIHGALEEIGIWELHNKEWKEIARMPQEFIEVLGNLDSVISSGCGDFIYVQSRKSTTSLMFDFNRKVWEKVGDAPISLPTRESNRYLEGFCFEPRLDICP